MFFGGAACAEVDVDVDVFVDEDFEPQPVTPTASEMTATATPKAAADFFMRSLPALSAGSYRHVLAGLNHVTVNCGAKWSGRYWEAASRILHRTNAV
jgi:hypothetical protein